MQGVPAQPEDEILYVTSWAGMGMAQPGEPSVLSHNRGADTAEHCLSEGIHLGFSFHCSPTTAKILREN